MKNRFEKIAAVGLLSSALLGCGTSENIRPHAAVEPLDKAVDTHSAIQVQVGASSPYVTKYSLLLQEFEKAANAEPLSNQRIILLDRDKSAAVLVNSNTHYATLFPIEKQLAEHHVIATRMQLSDMRIGMGRYTFWVNPNAMIFGERGGQYGELDAASALKDVCVVIPDTSDLYAPISIWGYIGEDDMVRKDVYFEAGSITKRTIYHEMWHCRDTAFLPFAYKSSVETEKSSLAAAQAIHRSELFADVAAALQMRVEGYTSITEQWANLRAIRTGTQGRESAESYSSKFSPQYYSAGIYFTSAGLDKVNEHVKNVGAETVSQYTLSDIKRIAEDITRQTALTPTQMKNLSGFLKDGDAYLLRLSEDDRRFIDFFRDRLRVAESVLLTTDPVQGLPRLTLSIEPYEYLAQTPQDIVAEVKAQFNEGLLNHRNPADVYLELLDRWRNALHSAPYYQDRVQTKILTLDVLLNTGYVTDLVNQNKVRAPAP